MRCEKNDIGANLTAHCAALEHAAAEGCDLAVFPEFSLTGSVDPARHPEATITTDDPALAALAAATARTGVAAVFGLAERERDRFLITQAVVRDGELVGLHRKRHLGEDEKIYKAGTGAFTFPVGTTQCGIVICAEGGVDWTWDETVAAGARVICFCSAPGLYGRRTDEAAWRAGFEWWHQHGLERARTTARRLDIWIALATQAGATVDEDFPGIAALIAPDGSVVDRLPDWRPGRLVVDVDA